MENHKKLIFASNIKYNTFKSKKYENTFNKISSKYIDSIIELDKKSSLVNLKYLSKSEKVNLEKASVETMATLTETDMLIILKTMMRFLGLTDKMSGKLPVLQKRNQGQL